MTLPLVFTAIVMGLMLAESRVSSRHERALLARGAEAPPEPQYPAMAITYPVAFASMGLEGAWRHAGFSPWVLSGVLLFAAGKALKYWAIASLGERWTFRVLILRGAPLVEDGPYRYLAHPNYVGVVGELLGATLVTGAVVCGPLMTLVFAALLWRRIRFEERALQQAADVIP
jgi:methyltransferase